MQKKFNSIKKAFSPDKSEKEIYNEILLFGKKASPFPKTELKKENLIKGCQSELYLYHTFNDGKIHFSIESEALISKGLAAIFTYLYSDEDPKTLFTEPPTTLDELNVLKKVSMNRQVGIVNLWRQMQILASKYI